MKLWKKAAAVLKDRKSLFAASLGRRTTVENPELESAVIHATSHDESSVDYRNAHRVYKWIRASPANLRPLVHALSSRVNRSRSWVVALKSLMLIHGVLCCKVPSISEIRGLPFNLSTFSDGHSRPSKIWGFNAFVRAYFSFLDHYSSFLSEQFYRHRENRKSGQAVAESCSLGQELDRIQKLQSLLDMLLQIRPMGENMKRTLILEAMDCVVIEIIDIYGRICSAIAKVLVKIQQNAARPEAAAAPKIVRKATAQGEDLAFYFEFCKEFGVANAHEIPEFVRIPEEDMRAISRAVNDEEEDEEEEEEEEEGSKAIVVVEEEQKKKRELRTIITHQWEVFEDDDYCSREVHPHRDHELVLPPLIDFDQPVCINRTVPDLITFW